MLRTLVRTMDATSPDALDSRPLHAAKYTSRRALLGLFNRDRSNATLFVPSSDAVSEGTSVRLKVTFGDCNRNFYVAGWVQSVREAAGQRVGFNLVIQAGDEQRAAAHLLAFCARNQEPAKRYPTTIGCALCIGREKLGATIRDLSMTGAFVAAKDVTPALPGAKIELEVRGGLFGLRSTLIPAHVVWRGEKYGKRGFGAEFAGSSPQLIELLNKHRPTH